MARASPLQNPVSTAACFGGIQGPDCDAPMNNEEYEAGCVLDGYHGAVCHGVRTKRLKSARQPATGNVETRKAARQCFLVTAVRDGKRGS